MTKRDPKAYLSKFIAQDALGKLMGAKMLFVSQEEGICEYEAVPEHYNPNGILHGGALYSIMDSAQGAFIHFILEEKFKTAATGTATIKYLAAVRSGKIRIRTWLKEIQNRKYFISSEATIEDGTVVATLDEIWIGILKT